MKTLVRKRSFSVTWPRAEIVDQTSGKGVVPSKGGFPELS
jgi:hypothetical protein